MNNVLSFMQILIMFYAYGQCGYLETTPGASFGWFTVRIIIAAFVWFALQAFKKKEVY